MDASTATPEVFRQALSYLLPQGYAWPRDPGSVWMMLLQGDAALLAEHHQVVQQAAAQWLPQLTNTRLEEWEEACGLPDPCFGPLQTYEARRAAVLARLRGFLGAYADSSPASLGSIQRYIANLGFAATISYGMPFRVGRNRCGDRLGATGHGTLNVTVNAPSLPLRVGAGRVGQRLIQRPPGVGELVCSLAGVVPARFAINVVLI